MSATLIPTKPAGERPPILPPVATTFDGSMDDGDDWLAHLQEDVRIVCRHADAAHPESLETMLGFLDRRRRLVLSEFWAYEATEGKSLSIPPIGGFSIDYLAEAPTREQRILQGLLGKLEECRARCERRLSRFRFEARLSHDLGTSDS